MRLLQEVLSSSSSSSAIPWSAVHHLVADVCYGGRVTDRDDQHCLSSLLKRYCNQETNTNDEDVVSQKYCQSVCAVTCFHMIGVYSVDPSHKL